MSDPAHMFCKIVRSGKAVEAYIYSNAIKVGHERKHDVCKRKAKDYIDLEELEELEKRSDNLYRARQTVRRLIWANQGSFTKFITLTYRDTELDRNRVHRDITTFVQAVRRKDYEMLYLYVLEHQKERGEKEGNLGCWHVHMVVFNDAFLPKEILEKCWPHGFVDINAIDDVRDLGAYVCKYITKENSSEFGSRVFSASKGLKRPEVERFYTEGFSDSMTGIFPKKILKNLNVSYHDVICHDYIDDQGVGHSQKIAYYQGTWKDEDSLTQERMNYNEP